MSYSKVEGSLKNWKAIIDELIVGHDLAAQLGSLLQEESPMNFRQTSTTKDISQQIMFTFSRALAALDAGLKPDDKKKASSGRKPKIQSGQRGGYRMRSQPSSSTSTIAKTTEDGHSWRKYGQKAIHGAKFSRSYFRCTHKFDQGCQAAKQVQRSEEDPSLFGITYFGEHTCRDPTELFTSSLWEDSCIIDFASNERPKFSVSKQESCEVVARNHSSQGSSSRDFLVASREAGIVEGPAKLVGDYVRGRDHKDVTSELQSSTDDLCRDFTEESFRLDNFVNFEEDGFSTR